MLGEGAACSGRLCAAQPEKITVLPAGYHAVLRILLRIVKN